MLSSETMFAALEVFCDASSDRFTGYATTREQARARWSDAFDAFLGEIEDRLGRASEVDLPGARETVTLDGARGAFFAALDLAASIATSLSALDFASAWRAGMNAFGPGVGSTVPGETVLQNFQGWVPLDLEARYGALLARLTTIFGAPATTVRAQLDEIAKAFDTATAGIQALSVSGETLVFR